MSRLKDLPTTATVPAADDFGVIDGALYGPRKIHFGSASVRDVPPPGSIAGPGVVVLGDDPRFSLPEPVHALRDLSDVSLTTPGESEHLIFSSTLGRWINNSVTDGGNF